MMVGVKASKHVMEVWRNGKNRSNRISVRFADQLGGVGVAPLLDELQTKFNRWTTWASCSPSTPIGSNH
jgi:hypothetical protein